MDKRLSAAEFSIIFAQRAPRLAWLMGAGCSAAAGIPTAEMMVMDFKATLFAAAMHIPKSDIELGDPIWVSRLNTHFDGSHGFPTVGDPTEYAVAFEAVYPAPEDRRSYMETAVRRGVPSFGHKVLASLISARLIPCIFTPNFDPLVERSTVVTDSLLPAADQVHLTVADLDDVGRAERSVREFEWPLLAKVHGDYKSENLKNVPSELRDCDVQMRQVLLDCSQRFGLVSVGYSGRDDSLMDVLDRAVASDGAFPHGLYWVSRPGSALLPRVAKLLQDAAMKGIDAHLVEANNFDEFCGELALQTTLPAVLAAHVGEARPASRVTPVSLPTVESGRFPALRCSALPLIVMPSHARRLKLSASLTTAEARSALRAAHIQGAVSIQGFVAAVFGMDSALVLALAEAGAQLDGVAPLDPLADSWALGLLYEALARALARGGRPLVRRLVARRQLLVLSEPRPEWTDEGVARQRESLKGMETAYGGPVIGTIPDIGLPFAEAVEIRLEFKRGQWWCVFDPRTWVDDPPLPEGHSAAEHPRLPRRRHATDPAADWRRERWATRYNRDWARIIDAWARLLAPYPETRVSAFKLGEGEGIGGEFVLGKTTAFSRPGRRDWGGGPRR